MSQMVAAFDPAIKGSPTLYPRLAVRIEMLILSSADHNGAYLLFGQPLVPIVDHAKGEENETRFWAMSEKLAKQEFKLLREESNCILA